MNYALACIAQMPSLLTVSWLQRTTSRTRVGGCIVLMSLLVILVYLRDMLQAVIIDWTFA